METRRPVTDASSRPGRLGLRRRSTKEWTYWCANGVRHEAGVWSWDEGSCPVTVTLRSGRVVRWEPDGYGPELPVGFGRLKLRDPLPRRYPQATLAADAGGEIVLEIRTGTGWGATG